MILDATAGNRTMWHTKNLPNIIYIDIEKKLAVKPTIFADNTNTPFLPESFNAIFFDPPHYIKKESIYFGFPDAESYRKVWHKRKKYPTYYGSDKYGSRQKLMAHLYKAQKEFKRILKQDGLLWLKWNEIDIKLYRVLAVFQDWTELLRIYVKAPTQTASEAQTYWVCLTKQKKGNRQTELLSDKLTDYFSHPLLNTVNR